MIYNHLQQSAEYFKILQNVQGFKWIEFKSPRKTLRVTDLNQFLSPTKTTQYKPSLLLLIKNYYRKKVLIYVYTKSLLINIKF